LRKARRIVGVIFLASEKLSRSRRKPRHGETEQRPMAQRRR
jgi:hypothetical protein